MKIAFNTRHFAPTQELSDFVTEQMKYLEDSFANLLKSGSVTISQENGHFVARTRLLGKRVTVTVEGMAKEPEVALSYALDHADTQLSKLHDKCSGHRPSRKKQNDSDDDFSN